MLSANSWKVVLVVRPQPGQAVTLGAKATQAERLQQLAGRVDFVATIAAGTRRERDADGIANALIEQNSHGSGGPHETFCAHASFGEAEVQRLIGFCGEIAIDGD